MSESVLDSSVLIAIFKNEQFDEDILNVIDGRPGITREISEQHGEVATYLKTEFDELISDNLFIETLPSHFLPGPLEQQRVPILFGRLREIAGL